MELIIDFSDRTSKQRLFDHLKELTGEWTVNLSRGRWTYQQLKFYFAAIVKPIAETTGHDRRDIHFWLKSMFLTNLVITPSGEKWQVLDFRDIDIVELSDYIDKCIQFCAENIGFAVQDPEDYLATIEALKAPERKNCVEICSSIPNSSVAVVKGADGIFKVYSNTELFKGILLSPLDKDEWSIIDGDGANAISVIKVANSCYRFRTSLPWLSEGVYRTTRQNKTIYLKKCKELD